MASFDDLAPWYGPLERWLSGGVMSRARLALLDQLNPPERVLLIGEGPGALVRELGRCFPGASLTCVDGSGAMIEVGRRHVGATPCEWIQADIRTDEIRGKPWDLVVTSFVLDCFTAEELERLVPKLATMLRDDGEWLQVDFQIPEKGLFKAWRAAVVVWLLYRFFRLAAGLSARKLNAPQPFFTRAGLSLKSRQEKGWGLVYAEIWCKSRRDHQAQASAGASAADC